MKWEYKSITRNAESIDHIDDDLNELGEKGWELVTVSAGGYLIFKREILSRIDNTGPR